MSEREKLNIVDENGLVLGLAPRERIYGGLLHPAVTVAVFNSEGQIYIQQRNGDRPTFPLYWDISAAEHVKPGEGYKKAARRGLREELGVSAKVRLLRGPHIQVSTYLSNGRRIIENERAELYGAIYDGEIKNDSKEVAIAKPVGLRELGQMLVDYRTQFTPWGRAELAFILANQESVSQFLKGRHG